MKKMVLAMQGLSYQAEDEDADLQGIEFELPAGKRVFWILRHPQQSETLWRLLQQGLRPTRGQLLLPEQDQCYSDRRLLQNVNANHSAWEVLQSARFVKRPWVGSRPRTWSQLADALELSHSSLQKPLAALREPQHQRAIWLLIFCLEVELLCLSQLLPLMDGVAKSVVQEWWPTFPGGVLGWGSNPGDLAWDVIHILTDQGTLAPTLQT